MWKPASKVDWPCGVHAFSTDDEWGDYHVQ